MGGLRGETVMEGGWRNGGCVKVMLTDKEMGGEKEDDEWPSGQKASEAHFSLSLDMSLSKALNPSGAPVNQQQNTL